MFVVLSCCPSGLLQRCYCWVFILLKMRAKVMSLTNYLAIGNLTSGFICLRVPLQLGLSVS